MTRFRLRDELLSWRMLDGEVVALDADRSLYLGANPSGAALWTRLADGASRDELIAALTQAYAVDTARAASDVDSFLAALADAGLLAADDAAA